MISKPIGGRFPAVLVMAGLVVGVPLSAQTLLPEPMKVQVDSPYAQPLPIERGAAGLRETLRRLRTRASLLQINAHPDDEDGGMLTYVSRGEGADVSLLSLNRGEGGQNVMTGDFWDELGVLRTQEHLAANRYYGVHLFYTRVADFGFSKTLSEALRQWGHDRLLEDAVRIVRTVRPMVVTSVFAGYVSDGHGHHQTAGLIAQEVYDAAGDPTMFPEQIAEGLLPWRPLKMYARVPFAQVTAKGIFDYATNKWEPVAFRNYITGRPIEGVPSATLTVPEGSYNALYGSSYLQIAREGLNEQKSQIGGVAIPPPGEFDSPYHLYAARAHGGPLPAHETNFFDGIDTDLAAMAGYLPGSLAVATRTQLAAIAAKVDEATAHYDADDPARCAPALADGLRMTRELIATMEHAKLGATERENVLHELKLKREQFNLGLAQALGISLLATVQRSDGAIAAGPPGPRDTVFSGAASSATAIPGQTLQVDLHVAAQGSAAVIVEEATMAANTGGDWQVKTAHAGTFSLAAGVAADVMVNARVPADAAITEPYYSRPTLEQSYYDIHVPQYLGLPVMPYPLTAVVKYRFGDVVAEVREVVQTANRENGLGQVLQPLLIAPAISVRVLPQSGVLPLTTSNFPLEVMVHSSVKGPAEGTVKLSLPDGWTADPQAARFQTTRDNEETSMHFKVTPHDLQAKSYEVGAVAESQTRQYRAGFRMIGYPGVLPYPSFRPAQARLTGVDVKVAPGLRVGFVMGTGEEVPASLRDVGVQVAMLTTAEIASADLSGYDCIVLGIRTYAAKPELRQFNQRLLHYVEQGGVVLSEYQSPEFESDIAPYPLTVGRDAEKVVEESAKVTILQPDDPLLRWPNTIGPHDFEKWVEERGHGFPAAIDPHYRALTSVEDEGQTPQLGGLLYAPYGKGYYLYLAYAFFRQMPEGVPGSFRLMANLISLRKNPYRAAPK